MTTLTQLIGSSALGYERFLDLAVRIIEKVAAFHDNAVVLGTISADTIFVEHDNQIIVADPESTQVGRANVQPYLSPEQLSGKEPEPRSDLFALGVLFYQMLTGKVPFEGETNKAQLASITREHAEGIFLSRVDIPSEARLVISKLLEPEPSDRFSSSHELLATLKAIQADKYSKVEVREADSKRHSPRTYLVLAGITVAIVVFWWLVAAFKK
ncbi:MAG TPA: protein kinase [Candidatus Acidoferrum sp.]|nr:protein kinase [Candidatus Acidoferrum sp.]